MAAVTSTHARMRATLGGSSHEQDQQKAIQFVVDLWSCNIPKIAIENPIGILVEKESDGS